jgi:stage V sporulation protein D (sporulation-specific penicillin-binding protein)
MAAYPDFDPNQPGNLDVIGTSAAIEEQKAVFDELSTEEQSAYLSKLWRNPAVSDLYEPGSVFKLLTVSSAIEEGTVAPSSNFECKGIITVEDRQIHCHIHPMHHGWQTVTEAVANSCNPVMVQIIRNMGYDRYVKYLDLFNVSEKTGIDLPAEASPLIQDRQTAGPVGIATMSFGMGLNVTPIQTISAVSSIGNDGNYMQPRIVKGLADAEGNMVAEFEPTLLRQVVSKQTAEDVQDIMQFVTDKDGGNAMYIDGYKIGSKTGTAQKLVDGQYSDTDVVASAIAMAPMDDPQYTVLVIVDTPEAGGFGSTTAAPAVHDIMEEILRYAGIKPTEELRGEDQQSKKGVEVPELTGLSSTRAAVWLEGIGLDMRVDGETVTSGAITGSAFEVKAQYPAAGERVASGGAVYVYRR